ncbi:MAG: photosystem reaction center subunit H [Anaerovibrio sp.]|uniref:PRC-barrel domain-containing protein n=1 Tax=Anaerovibrio sp. TaxID=1872532 RepID=UPI0025C16A6A|nr:PRC-barrel domain-containing protein [Anaerovibrio sp.]MBE6098954.1 photosystem reaction center subunit H [Anaerovibrio sp.]
MKKSVEIIGLPVISITEGRELGMSKSLLIDAKNGAIAAIIIEDEDWYRGVKLLPYSSVVAIGADAVTVVNSETILTLEDAGDYETMMDENVKVIGTKAITKSGTIQGNVVEIYVGEGGKIEKCEIESPDGSLSEITSDQISIFGKQVTIIDSDVDGEKKTENLTDAAPAPADEPAEETVVEETADTVEEDASESEAEATAETAEEVPEPEAVVEEEPAEEEVVEAEEAATEDEPAEDNQEEASAEQEDEEPAEEETEPEPAAEEHQPDSLQQAADSATVDRQRRFIINKKARRTLTSPTGVVIVNEGDTITDEVIQRAKLSGMFVQLTLNVQ